MKKHNRSLTKSQLNERRARRLRAKKQKGVGLPPGTHPDEHRPPEKAVFIKIKVVDKSAPELKSKDEGTMKKI